MKKNIYNTANFFWEGELTIYEKTAIYSFVNNGFFVNLWTFSNSKIINQLENKNNIEIKDANLIISKKNLGKFTQNSQRNNLSSFSNLFRYKILNEFGGWWFDTDCICLKNVQEFKKLTQENDFIIGKSGFDSVNGSVMFFNDDNHMSNLVEVVELKLQNKNVNFKWGEIGPSLLTNYLIQNNILDKAMPENYFYEIPPSYFYKLFSTNPGVKIDLKNRLESSYVSHLWNEMYRRYLINKHKLPPKDSLIYDFIIINTEIPQNIQSYSSFFNVRFSYPVNFVYKILSRFKVIFKNLNK